jgi:putative endonuclease
MTHSVYILRSKSSGRYYVGMSENPERRLEFHNTKEKGFTSRYRPWELVFARTFATKEEALVVERKIKSWKSRTMIERLLAGEIAL